MAGITFFGNANRNSEALDHQLTLESTVRTKEPNSDAKAAFPSRNIQAFDLALKNTGRKEEHNAGNSASASASLFGGNRLNSRNIPVSEFADRFNSRNIQALDLAFIQSKMAGRDLAVGASVSTPRGPGR